MATQDEQTMPAHTSAPRSKWQRLQMCRRNPIGDVMSSVLALWGLLNVQGQLRYNFSKGASLESPWKEMSRATELWPAARNDLAMFARPANISTHINGALGGALKALVEGACCTQ